MRSFIGLLGFLISVTTLFAAEDFDPWKKLPEYGAKNDAAMTVRISGDGIGKPGTYYLAPGTTLLALLKQADLSRLASQFEVTRYVEGYWRAFSFRWMRAKQPPLPDFPLIDGDYVVARIPRDP